MLEFFRRMIERGRGGPSPEAEGIVPPPAAPSASPREVKRMIERGRPVLLLDVREAREVRLARIEGAVPIPADDLLERHEELDADCEIIPFCHYGMRGEWAAEQLIRLGYPRVRCLEGGIDAWSRDVDPSIPRY